MGDKREIKETENGECWDGGTITEDTLMGMAVMDGSHTRMTALTTGGGWWLTVSDEVDRETDR